jgi:hypothetical protein
VKRNNVIAFPRLPPEVEPDRVRLRPPTRPALVLILPVVRIERLLAKALDGE